MKPSMDCYRVGAVPKPCSSKYLHSTYPGRLQVCGSGCRALGFRVKPQTQKGFGPSLACGPVVIAPLLLYSKGRKDFGEWLLQIHPRRTCRSTHAVPLISTLTLKSLRFMWCSQAQAPVHVDQEEARGQQAHAASVLRI